MADIPIIPGVKVATKGILNKPLKDIICAILFGGLENMLKGNLLCVQADIDALIQDNFPGTPSIKDCLLYTSPSPRDGLLSRMPSSA